MLDSDRLYKRLVKDFPALTFRTGRTFSYRRGAITINPSDPAAHLLTLHELAHAILEHSSAPKTIDRLTHERDAWEYVKNTLAPRYKIAYNRHLAAAHLATYQDYLHKKSLCPKCRQPRLETKPDRWYCPYCI